MAYEYREPDVVETRRETVVEDSGSSAGWAVVIVLAVLVVLGLVGYYAFATPGRSDTTNVRVETPADNGRAQDIHVDAPDVNVAPPSVNVQPPVINNNPPASNPSSEGTSTPDTSGQ
jgi:hypothetical protein